MADWRKSQSFAVNPHKFYVILAIFIIPQKGIALPKPTRIATRWWECWGRGRENPKKLSINGISRIHLRRQRDVETSVEDLISSLTSQKGERKGKYFHSALAMLAAELSEKKIKLRR